MIRLRDIHKEYPNGTKALKGVSMQIDDGDFVFLVGPSGSGKSTIIKLITAEIAPTKGKLMVNGYNLNDISEKQIPLLRRTIGVVFQDFRLIANKTVRDNLALAMRAVGASPRELKNRIPYVLELVGLADKENRYPDELSGGEQQRVAIARALAKNPKLLLCDEPTGALDYKTGKQILQLLQDTCRKQGITVIIITHNSALAPMADRLIRFKSGRVESETVQQNPVPIETIEW